MQDNNEPHLVMSSTSLTPLEPGQIRRAYNEAFSGHWRVVRYESHVTTLVPGDPHYDSLMHSYRYNRIPQPDCVPFWSHYVVYQMTTPSIPPATSVSVK